MVSDLVVQEMDRARRCWGQLYGAWTGQTRPHWSVGAGLRTGPRGGQWLWRQEGAAGMKDAGSRCPPHRGQGGPLPLEVPVRPALRRAVRVSGAPRRRWSADGTGRASRRPRARSLHGGHRAAGWALQKEERKREDRASELEMEDNQNSYDLQEAPTTVISTTCTAAVPNGSQFQHLREI